MSFRYRLSRKREEGVHGAYRKRKGGMGSLTELYLIARSCTELYTESLATLRLYSVPRQSV